MWRALQDAFRRQTRGPQTEQHREEEEEGALSQPAAGAGLESTSCSDLLLHPLFGPHEDFQQSKRAFLAVAGEGYGYQAAGSCVDVVRRDELRRMHQQAYLDCGGAALYSERQLGDVFEELSTQLLTNPHSAHGASGSSGPDAESELRRLTLDMLHASGQDYEVVLTSGATAAIKLVGECLPWSPASTLTYTLHNHNSVLGLREYALSAQATVHTVDLLHSGPSNSNHDHGPAGPCNPCKAECLAKAQDAAGQSSACGASSSGGTPALGAGARLGSYHIQHCSTLRRHKRSSESSKPSCSSSTEEASSCAPPPGLQPGPVHLFALPLECNFSGLRYDLSAACQAQAGGLRHLQQHSFNGCTSTTSSVSPAGASVPPTPQAGGRCLVLLDAAKGCSTAPPDLAAHPVDFVALSYYKIFGYPTGLGALVVRKDALPLLRKRYFAGGTVLVSVADEDFVQRRPGHAGLEDGTLPFTAIAAARHGFRFLQRLGGFPAISRHAHSLAQHLAHSLIALRHPNGQPAAEVYGWGMAGAKAAVAGPGTMAGPTVTEARAEASCQGPTVAFNLLRADGSYVGYAEVRSLAALHGLHLRCGCFCNPGACAKFLNLKGDDLRENFAAGHVCWDDQDLVAGRPTGAVRASLGALTTFEEVHLLLRLIHHYWLRPDTPAVPQLGEETAAAARSIAKQAISASMAAMATTSQGSNSRVPDQVQQPAGRCASPPSSQGGPTSSPGCTVGRLTGLFLYPVKSCAAQQVSSWPVGPTGLLYDREWALLDDSGRVVTQKKCPRMAALTPSVDLHSGTLTLSMPGCGGRLVVSVAGGATAPSGEAREAQEEGGKGAEGTSASVGWGAGMGPVASGAEAGRVETIQVCGDRVCGLLVDMQRVVLEEAGCGASTPSPHQQQGEEAVRQWFQRAIGIPCRLVRQSAGARRTKRTDVRPPATPGPADATYAATAGDAGGSGSKAVLGVEAGSAVGFANDGQYLLVNSASIVDLNARLAGSSPRVPIHGARPSHPADERRFRPNLVVDGFAAYAEDSWLDLQVGSLRLDVLGTCPRCEMLQVDQEIGMRGRADILIELAQYRRQGGKMHFGLLLAAPPSCTSDAELHRAIDSGSFGDLAHDDWQWQGQVLSVGMPVTATMPVKHDVVFATQHRTQP